MCDYSLQNFKSRPAVIGDKLVVHDFGTGTKGFKAVDDIADGPGYRATAVCILPGTELAFDVPVSFLSSRKDKMTIFRQIFKDQPYVHHDCLEFPSGEQVLLTYLDAGQRATVLQLPADPKTQTEAEEQHRVEVVA